MKRASGNTSLIKALSSGRITTVSALLQAICKHSLNRAADHSIIMGNIFLVLLCEATPTLSLRRSVAGSVLCLFNSYKYTCLLPHRCNATQLR